MAEADWLKVTAFTSPLRCSVAFCIAFPAVENRAAALSWPHDKRPRAIENKLPPERRRRVDEFSRADHATNLGRLMMRAAIESFRNCNLSESGRDSKPDSSKIRVRAGCSRRLVNRAYLGVL